MQIRIPSPTPDKDVEINAKVSAYKKGVKNVTLYYKVYDTEDLKSLKIIQQFSTKMNLVNGNRHDGLYKGIIPAFGEDKTVTTR